MGGGAGNGDEREGRLRYDKGMGMHESWQAMGDDSFSPLFKGDVTLHSSFQRREAYRHPGLTRWGAWGLKGGRGISRIGEMVLAGFIH